MDIFRHETFSLHVTSGNALWRWEVGRLVVHPKGVNRMANLVGAR